MNRFRLNFIAILLVYACLSMGFLPSLGQMPYNGWQSLNDSEALKAQSDQAIKREITVEARVKKLLATDTEGLPHQKFLIELSNGSTILIAHDLKMAPAVPIQAGDIVSIHGEYIWNSRGGLIHWTHHTDTPRHEGGWIDFNGSRYQ